jgi:Contractile injection system tube protein
MTLNKAWLIELDEKLAEAKGGGKSIPVQFNPETLKVTYANQLVEPKNGDKAAGTSGLQFVGPGSTKLALQLWFDVNAMIDVVRNDSDHTNTGEQGIVDDVRRLTQHVVYFMTPQKSEDPKRLTPPGLRFEWGSFSFNGIVEAMEETLEFFSAEGKPLRASITMTLPQQKILERDARTDSANFVKPTMGHKPLAVAKAGNSLQGMASAKGKDDWQGIAAANGIEDPLRIPAGTFIDLNASVTAGLAAGSRQEVGAALRAGASAGAGLNAALGGASSASLSLG